MSEEDTEMSYSINWRLLKCDELVNQPVKQPKSLHASVFVVHRNCTDDEIIIESNGQGQSITCY